ncbi:MAG: hypothetical protein JNG83_12690, partial [Opitutaceae bacterium]|nr:hypothetical protein [Opitutaceae bacterium]
MEFASPTPLPHETAVDYSLLGGAHAERGRRLFRTGLALLFGALGYLAYSARVQDPFHLYLGLTIFTLAVVPCLLWARSGGSRFPVFEPIMLLCANAYAIPMLNSSEQLAGYPPEVVTRAGWAVILHQVAGLLVYTQTRGFPGRSRFWREALVTQRMEKFLVYGLVLSTAYVWVSAFTNWIPAELVSILRAIFYGAGILCTFVSAQRWGRGDLNQSEKFVLLVMLLLQMAAMAVSLILIGVLSLIGIALLGYLSGGKRVPWLTIAVAFATLAVLHNGKTEMREKYWEQKAPPPTLTRLPDFFGEWIVHGLQPPADDKNVSRRLLERTSLMHIL